MKNNTFYFDNKYHEPIYSPIGNKTMQNITKETDDKFAKFVDPSRNIQLFSLDNATKEIDYSRNKFKVLNGIRKRQNVEDESSIIRGTEDNTLNREYIFPFEDEYTNQIKNISCTLKYVSSLTMNEMEYEIYDAECNPNGNLITNINQAIGFDSSGKNKDTFIMFNVTDDFVDLNNNNYSGELKYYKKSSNGISRGAIAGIVIVCAAALVIISLLILYIRRQRKNENEINSNSSSSAVNTVNIKQNIQGIAF